MKLEIELVPKTCHFRNVRSEVTQQQWDKLRRQTYRNASYKCEICGEIGSNHPVECHEVWDYDDDKHIQRLDRLIALCPACHEVKHMGLAQLKGYFERAKKHFAKVNDITELEAIEFIKDAFAQYATRSSYQWELDISWLEEELAHLASERPTGKILPEEWEIDK